MKGSAKIELISKVSGNVVKTINSDNLVTNAINNIFNIPTTGLLRFKDGETDSRSDLGEYYRAMFGSSLADKMLCGILCFSSDILEDETHCIPTNTEMDSLVAYAGKRGNPDPYNSLRGNFDSVNSIIGSNYASFVFNWDTSEGNGIIKSICLTSMMGGEQAYHGSQMELRKTICNFGDFEAMGSLVSVIDVPDQPIGSQQMCTTPDGYSNTAGYITRDGKLVLMSIVSLSNIRFGVWNFLSNDGFGISTSLTREYTIANMNNSVQRSVAGILVNVDFTPLRLAVSQNSICLINCVFNYPNTVVNGVIFTGDMAVMSEFSVALSNIEVFTGVAGELYGGGALAVVNGYLYCRPKTASDTIYKVRIDTGEINVISLPSGLESFALFDDQLLVILNSGETYRVSNIDMSLHLFTVNDTYGRYAITKVDTLPEPLMVSYPAYINSESRPALCYLTPYLGTINNLKEPVTKTSAQSMRITYTLTDS